MKQDSISVKAVQQSNKDSNLHPQTKPPANKRARSARGQPLVWLSVVLTVVLLFLIIAYSSQTPLQARLHFLYSSSSRNIFILSILSGLTGLLLAATMNAALDNVKWMLISRP